ncbi:hypothetical protein RM697_06285 [Ichthyenterobacterium sp. W332]|uniref:Repeat protein (TIGR03806 family) n=1 Tax=Microcosmobacter mediterraneus TaxID=3075607 RepID=A0ABU2YJA0_9FLAO|nr:hypothetical protein [Ichthyenterobacterium sp. W332]MDT0558244.1 hypothetical protein [Ichthyenterobacterium sp. W332]
MLKSYYNLIRVLVSSLFLVGCSSDDSTSYQPLNVDALDDTAQVFQNASITIDVLSNDINVIEEGTLNATTSANATIEVLNNNTPSNPSDDMIRYIPNGIFFGEDSFQYTICTSEQNCDTATVTVTVTGVSPVNFNLDNMPYDTLDEYNFFQGDMSDLDPVFGVLPYDLITPLFSDYASKKRFVWMPSGEKASYVNDYSILDFPVGTILIKSFYYDNVLPSNTKRIMETRLQIKKESGWVFANYKWNDVQTEAILDLNGSSEPIEFEIDGVIRNVNYSVPAGSQCLTCHKSDNDVPFPIGMKPQSLNKNYNYTNGSMNQLEKLEEQGYLSSGYPTDIVSHVDYTDDTQSLELRVRSYLDINCAHCHSENGHCNYRPVRFSFKESGEDIANLGVCVDAHEVFDSALTKIVEPGNADRSILAYRISTIEESLRMPLLARRLNHDKGIALVEDWINTLNTNCD